MMLLRFENITAGYGKKTVLDGFSLDIPAGSVTALIGRNGCGKSTLLGTIPGTVKPRAGAVLLDGVPIREIPPRMLARRVAYLPQLHRAPDDIDVRTLVSYGREPFIPYGKSLSASDRAAVNEAMEAAGIADLADRPLGTLSGGERQRAWIAMTAARTPELMVLDEPTTYLDTACQYELLALIRRLARERGMTVLMVLHDVNLAARFASRIAAVKDGRLHAVGTPAEMITPALLGEVLGICARVMRDEADGCPYILPDTEGAL